MNKDINIYLSLFFLFITNSLYSINCESKLINLFEKHNYSIKLANTFEELKFEVNKNKFQNYRVIYLLNKEKVFGFLFDPKDSQVNVFIENIKTESIFIYLLNPEIDVEVENIFDISILNLYSFYNINYNKQEIGYSVIEDDKLKFTITKVKNNKYYKFKSFLKNNNRPNFSNLQQINEFNQQIKYNRTSKKERVYNIMPQFLRFLFDIYPRQSER